MSFSDANAPATATPWALDELAMPDVFTPLAYGNDGHASLPDSPASENVRAESDAEHRAQVEREAYSRGHAVGVAEAQASAHSQVARTLDALLEAVASVQAHEQRWLANVEENLAAIAVTVARQLIHREVSVDNTVITDLITRALQHFPLERKLTVRLNPDDFAVVQGVLATGAIAAAEHREIRWAADAHIVRGGCLLDGRERVLDGRIDSALERAYRALSQVQA